MFKKVYYPNERFNIYICCVQYRNSFLYILWMSIVSSESFFTINQNRWIFQLCLIVLRLKGFAETVLLGIKDYIPRVCSNVLHLTLIWLTSKPTGHCRKSVIIYNIQPYYIHISQSSLKYTNNIQSLSNIHTQILYIYTTSIPVSLV